ncbi:helix-turn-helix domain-containing protein [Metabacillus arenae]|uniref:Helix-turn-helix domain-containing protein n=1 Tax=Metabacillus arenae TaxID=2771434 RepID=A0A926RUL1_9BACI|nr:helix-turn-helix domain-containing protein [Metabacillus arenae]MBD1378648.1 helix-turn-helix domain-containing protein [Metabacillus arenae]
MTKNYLDVVVLYSIKKLEGERSPSAVFHLLRGKKSSQTIQDRQLFHLSHLFSIFPKLSREEMNNCINRLEQKNLIEKVNENCSELTETGHSFLTAALITHPIPIHLNGQLYGDLGRVFWGRFSILTQVLSHLLSNNKNYIPITRDEQLLAWVKVYLKTQKKMKITELANGIYSELSAALDQLSNIECQVFVWHISSNDRVGFTFDQIAERIGKDIVYTQLLFWNVIHFLLKKTIGSKKPIFLSLLPEIKRQNRLTFSTEETRRLLKEGYSIKDAAVLRKLKESTIEDHIVEIALYDDKFSLQGYLTESEIDEIVQRAKELNTFQLKRLRDSLDNKFSYFQIRLAIAKAWR